jgi:hypothetical protein
MKVTKASQGGKRMQVRRILIAVSACGVIGSALGAGSAEAKTSPKPKDYTYCVKSATESECFTAPFEVFHKTSTWIFEESTSGTYTVSGNRYDFRETRGSGSNDELIGKKGKHGVISGMLYENGMPTEFAFTLTKR